MKMWLFLTMEASLSRMIDKNNFVFDTFGVI
jgi:hypothetical protein